MTDPLTNLLAQALETVLTRSRRPEDMLFMSLLVAAIDPAKADAMRAGLLLGEVERLRPGWRFIHQQGSDAGDFPDRHHAVIEVVLGDEGTIGQGPTLLAALESLLAKLRVQP